MQKRSHHVVENKGAHLGLFYKTKWALGPNEPVWESWGSGFGARTSYAPPTPCVSTPGAPRTKGKAASLLRIQEERRGIVQN